MPFRKLFADIYVTQTKTCCNCNVEKDIEEFVYMRTNDDYRSKVCRQCVGIFEHHQTLSKLAIEIINGTR